MIFETTPWQDRAALLDKAVREGRFPDVVRGHAEFECCAPGWGRHDAHTALYNIDRYISERGAMHLWRQFEDELVVMAKDPQLCWLSVAYIKALVGAFGRSQRLSPIGFALLQHVLQEQLPRFEVQLREMATHGPAYFEGEGMWGFVLHVLGGIRDDGYDFAVGLLPSQPQQAATADETAPGTKKKGLVNRLFGSS